MTSSFTTPVLALCAAHLGVASCGRSTPALPPVGTSAAPIAQASRAHLVCVQVDQAGSVVNDKLDEAALRQLLGQRILLRGSISHEKPGDFMGCPGAEVEVHVDDPFKVPATATGTLALVWEAHYHKSANEGKTRPEEMVQDNGSHWAVARFELKPE